CKDSPLLRAGLCNLRRPDREGGLYAFVSGFAIALAYSHPTSGCPRGGPRYVQASAKIRPYCVRASAPDRPYRVRASAKSPPYSRAGLCILSSAPMGLRNVKDLKAITPEDVTLTSNAYRL